MKAVQETTTVPVQLAEKPFSSIQGSGKSAGMPSIFIRFAGCNFYSNPEFEVCPFCDTGYALDCSGSEYSTKEVVEMTKNVDQQGIQNYVFTGGEPLNYCSEIGKIIYLIKDSCMKDIDQEYNEKITFEIETNGSLPIDFSSRIIRSDVRFVISPKLHMEYDLLTLDSVSNSCSDVILKFVYSKDHRDDIIEYIDKLDSWKHISRNDIYVMPECVTNKEHQRLQKEVAEFCIDHGVNYSPRLHIQIWDNERGK